VPGAALFIAPRPVWGGQDNDHLKEVLVGDDLTVSLNLLHELGKRLDQVAGDMKSDSKLSHFDREDLASADVVDAVHDFNGHWDNKREVLAGNLAALGDMATNAHQTFTEVDAKLAAQIRDVVEGRLP
jgi:ABC-type transporter Mla subunit MlaD